MTTATPTKKAALKIKAGRHFAIPDHPRNNLVPAEFLDTNYVHRQVAGVEDYTILDEAMATKHNVAFFGPTGSSKTSVVYGYAANRGLPLVNIACNGASDPHVIFGGLRPMPDATFRTRPTDVYYVMRYGGIVNLDEFNTMPPRIAVVFHAGLDARRMVTIDQYDGAEDLDDMGNTIVPTFKLSPKCIFTASFNPGYHGTIPMNEATFNRFALKLPWGYEKSVEETLVYSQRLIDFAWNLRRQLDVGTIVTPVPTNTLCEFELFSQSLGVKFAAENFLAAFPPSEREGVRNSLTPNLSTIALEISEQLDNPSVYERYMSDFAEPAIADTDADPTTPTTTDPIF